MLPLSSDITTIVDLGSGIFGERTPSDAAEIVQQRLSDLTELKQQFESESTTVLPTGDFLTSTNCLPVVVRIMCKSTLAPASFPTSFPPRFFNSASLAFTRFNCAFASFARIFFSRLVNFVGSVYSSSSSQSSQSSSDEEGVLVMN